MIRSIYMDHLKALGYDMGPEYSFDHHHYPVRRRREGSYKGNNGPRSRAMVGFRGVHRTGVVCLGTREPVKGLTKRRTLASPRGCFHAERGRVRRLQTDASTGIPLGSVLSGAFRRWSCGSGARLRALVALSEPQPGRRSTAKRASLSHLSHASAFMAASGRQVAAFLSASRPPRASVSRHASARRASRMSTARLSCSARGRSRGVGVVSICVCFGRVARWV